jgi:hypothetical protein
MERSVVYRYRSMGTSIGSQSSTFARRSEIYTLVKLLALLSLPALKDYPDTLPVFDPTVP